MKQKEIFFGVESDKWFERNRSLKDSPPDLVVDALHDMGIRPLSLLEIGASDGRRLRRVKDEFNSSVSGIEPSEKAVATAKSRYNIDLHRATADSLPFQDSSFDCVVMGFCLYLCDRGDLFRIALEADRVLSDQGLMVIYDFYADTPVKKAYHHLQGIWSYKMDYRQMFLWNPGYREIYYRAHQHSLSGLVTEVAADDRIIVSILEKNLENGYMER